MARDPSVLDLGGPLALHDIGGDVSLRVVARTLPRLAQRVPFADRPPARAGARRALDEQRLVEKHNAALICLARRRCDVLHAMLRTGTHYYTPPQPAAA